MVDVISGGRMILGVGIAQLRAGVRAVRPHGRRTRCRCSRSRSRSSAGSGPGEEVDHESEHFKVKGRIRPLPKNGGRLWMGAMSFPGVRRAARFGAPWPCDPLHNIHVIKEWADAYRAEGEKQGTSDKLSLSLLRDGWVADDMDQVERDWWPSIRVRALVLLLAGPALGGRPRAVPAGDRAGERLQVREPPRSTGSSSATRSSASTRSAASRTRSRTTT